MSEPATSTSRASRRGGRATIPFRIAVTLLAWLVTGVVAFGCAIQSGADEAILPPSSVTSPDLEPQGNSSSSGSVTCVSPQVVCSNRCVNEQTDSNNCGSCGNSCHGQNSCSNGVCCSSGQTGCNGSCKTTSTDNNNCGGCGIVCGSGKSCCGGVCTSTSTDTNNCGACGTSCPQPSSGTGSPTCSAGACGISCLNPNANLCSGACVFEQTDNNNCGSCGNRCTGQNSCSNGVCCGATQTGCSGSCKTTSTDSNNCGGCGVVCTGGRTCSNGACACPSGQSLCNGVCTSASCCPSGQIACNATCTNTLTDANNCGGCGNSCGGGTCNNGTCSCPAGKTLCNGSCVNEQTDKNNCGACGNACLSSDSTCSAGTCTCVTSTNTYCAGTGCTNLQTDNNNCGVCGNGGCGSCHSGACCNGGGNQCACGTGLTLCNSNTCKNLQTDASNCGMCGNACPSGVACINGSCGGCASGQTLCNGVCVNESTDIHNCGACGNTCTAGDSCCSGVCSDTSSDTSNCGGCGMSCGSTQTCSDSMCCGSGLANCSNMCVNTTSSSTNCGLCGKVCPSGQMCSSGMCTTGTSGGDAGSDAASSGDGGDSGSSGSSGSSGGGTSSVTLGPICSADPCNPYCVETDDPDADLTADAKNGTTTQTTTTTVVSYQASANGFGGCPPGFHSKEVNPNGCLTSGVPDYSQCNSDYHCDTTSGQCVYSQPGWSYPASVCPGIDLTISGACTDANGNVTMPLCNRGNTPVLAATYPEISYYLVNGDQFNFDCPTYNPPSGYITLTQDIAPGECINIWPPGVHGNTIMYINATHSVPECGAFAGPTVAPGCYDNWADVKVGGSCSPATQTQQTTAMVPAYSVTTATFQTTASCPTGTSPQWSFFTYDTSLASNASGTSSVLIQAQTAPVSPIDGGVGTYGPFVTFANTAAPTNDPAVCPYSGGPAGCPKNAYALLGETPATGYTAGAIKLTVTLTPTPDGQAISELLAWQLAYSCVPSE